MTVAQLLAEAKHLGVDRLDAQLLLARALSQSRSWLLAHDDAVLDETQVTRLRDELARRATGEPLAYLLGEKEFHGLMLRVDASVLVPRPDTEVLVDWALELLPMATTSVIDLGTGSGAIALAIKRARPASRVLATDLATLDTARANAARLGLDLRFAPGAWWEAAGTERFDLALSNPPYIAGADPHLPALHHEPTLALTPGGDGLGAIRQIIAGARHHLNPGAWLLLEHGFDQASAVQGHFRASGFVEIQTRRDLGGQARCTGAHL